MADTAHIQSGPSGKYLSLTSFRRDGTPVATPVWFVRDGERLLVHTAADSYKVRRIRHNASVQIAICTASGRLRGTPMRATAKVLADSEIARAEQLMAAKYRIDLLFFKPLRAIQSAFGRSPGRNVVVAITPVPVRPDEL